LITATPVFFNEDGSPKNPQLYSAVLGYLESEFSKGAPDLRKLGRVWACVEIYEGGESFRVVGVCGAGYVLDIPLFHSDSPKGFMAMFRRLYDWAEDLGVQQALVYVNPKSYRRVSAHLKMSKAEPAHRWKVKVGKLKE